MNPITNVLSNTDQVIKSYEFRQDKPSGKKRNRKKYLISFFDYTPEATDI